MILDNFLFYKYRFENTGERNLFAKEEEYNVDENLHNQRLIDDLTSNLEGTRSLNLFGTKVDRSGEESPEIFVNEIKQVANGVALIKVRNHKTKNIIPKDKDEKQKVDHYPYCWVIVDSRPGSLAILVQRKKEAFKDEGFVINLLKDYFNSSLGLNRIGWKMDTEQRFCVGTIWDVVKMRTTNGLDRVKSLSIKIKDKDPNNANDVDRAFQFIVDRLDASDAEIKLTSDDEAHKLLNEKNEDLKNTVNMLLANDYRMRIGFEKSGSVEYGQKSEAVYGVDDEVCKKFANGSAKLGKGGVGRFSLIEWLDTLMTEDAEHIYIQSEERTHGRRKRRQH